MSVHFARHARPRGLAELARGSERPEPPARRGGDGAPQVVRRQLLYGGREAEQLICRHAICRYDPLDGRTAQREGAGLVEDHRASPAELLDRRAGLDDDARVGGARHPRDHGHGSREDERAGRGHHEDCQHGRRIPGDQPGDGADREREGREPHGEPIGQPLDRRLLPPRPLHQPHDLLVLALLRRAQRAHPQRAVQIDAPRQQRRSLHRADREWLAGEGRLVDGRHAVRHLPIHRDQIAGPQEQQVTDPDLVDGNLSYVVARDAATHRGRTREQRLERLRRAAHRVPLQRFPARLHQHDHDAGEVLAHGERGHDGEHGHDVGREAAAQHAPERLGDERQSSREQGREEDLLRHGLRPEAVTGPEPSGEPRGCNQGKRIQPDEAHRRRQNGA